MRHYVNLDPTYVAKLAQMDARFLASHGAAIDEAHRHFTTPILKRTRNPHESKAVIHLESIAFSQRVLFEWATPAHPNVQSAQRRNTNPGLLCAQHTMASNSRALMIQTPAMKERRLFFFVLKDHSALFCRGTLDTDQVLENISVLPTPLSLQTALTRAGQDAPMRVSHKHDGFTNEHINLFVGDAQVARSGHLLEPSLRDETAELFLDQLTTEAFALEARLEAVGVYDKYGFDENIGKGTWLHRLGTYLPPVYASQDKMSFLARPQVTDEDAHFGQLKIDPSDPSLGEIVRLFDLAVKIATTALKTEPTKPGRPIIVSWLAPNPRSPNSNIVSQNVKAGQAKALHSKIVELLGTDAMRLARRHFGFTSPTLMKGDGCDDVALARISTNDAAFSNHEIMAMSLEAGDIRQKLPQYLRGSDAEGNRISAHAVHL